METKVNTQNQETSNVINVTLLNYKNQKLDEITTTPNAVILLQTSESSSGNQFIKGVCVAGLKKTDETSIIKHLLTAISAEFRVRNKFNGEFATINLNGATEQTGLTAKSLFARYLNTNIIFRSDSHGKIAKAIKINGQTLKDTALKVTNRHLLATCNRNDLRAVIHHQTKAVCAQFRYIDDLNDMISELLNEATTAKVTSETAKAKKTKATTATAKVTSETATATI